MTTLQYFLMKSPEVYAKYSEILTEMDTAPIYMVELLRKKILKLLNDEIFSVY